MSDGDWASDVPVSVPKPVARRAPGEPRIPMRGFVFTVNGLFHDLDSTMHDEYSTPTYLPRDPTTVIYGDSETQVDPDAFEFEGDV